METIRAFIAIPLPATLLDKLAALQRRLERQVPPRSVRWVRAEGIHLTLKFLGDTPTDRLPDIKQVLATVSRHAPACAFTAEGLGCFPNTHRPRVVWVGIREPTGRLEALQGAIEEVVAPLGFPPEGRNFSPHLTLGRIGRRASRSDAALVGQLVADTDVGTLAEVAADRFCLIRSVLKPSGAEYTTLEEFHLLKGADR
jgi:2'-5' RNA ligase